MANAGAAVAARHVNEDDLIIMASNLMFSRAEIEACQDLRVLIAARAALMCDSFVEQTVKEINKRGWATL